MQRVSIEGFYRDRVVGAEGRVLGDTGWRHNMIVLRCRILLGAFLKNDAALGIQSLQVGRGDPAWDKAGAASPDPATTQQLVDPHPYTIPVSDLHLEYLDESEAVTAGPTNRVQVVATLGPGKPSPLGSPPFPLREFALFGKVGAESYMIDCIRHPLIEKDASVTLERRVRLVL